ncbi:MAG TPA: hypothetical protein VLF91_01315 [Candidatus Saccharimonadales bacterium]|nr:hypothetical protein [Candidatus Saccharimonadales bacterium]
MGTVRGTAQGNRGFSVIEALLVVAVLAVVGGVSFMLYARNHQVHASGWTTFYADPGLRHSYTPTVRGCREPYGASSAAIRIQATRPNTVTTAVSAVVQGVYPPASTNRWTGNTSAIFNYVYNPAASLQKTSFYINYVAYGDSYLYSAKAINPAAVSACPGQ